MRFTRPRLIGIALLVVGLAIWLLFGRLTLFRTTEHPWYYPPELIRLTDGAKVKVEPIKVTDGVKVGQSFAAHYPGLYRVDVLLSTSGRRNVTDLVFHLQADGPEGEELFTTVVDGAAIVDNAFQPFTFPPLDDSAGRSYFFYLESPGAGPADAVGVRVSVGNRNPEGRLLVTGIEEMPADEETTAVEKPSANFTHKIFLPLIAASSGPGEQRPSRDAAFTVHYKGRPLASLPIFLDRLTANKPSFWGEVWFYLLLLVLYLALLAGVLRRIVRAQGPGEDC